MPDNARNDAAMSRKDGHEDCKQLHEALKSLRASLDPPQRDTSYPGAFAPIAVDPGDTTPDASEETHREIEQLEQALRDKGCDPEADWEEHESTPRLVGSAHEEVDVLAEDAREQREQMLAQTAEQRERLRSDGIDMPQEDNTIGEPVEQELARMEREDARAEGEGSPRPR